MNINEREQFNILYNKNIEDIDAGKYSLDIMKRYGFNIAIFRASPAMDGLTPVRRRILYAMFHNLKLLPGKQRTKCSSINGATMMYHPHLDVDKTITGMCKRYEYYLVLLDGHGDFGSIASRKVAALRYLEGRMSKFAYKCYFEDFDIDIVETIDTYTKIDVEPLLLPSKYPAMFLIGNMGIAWGIMNNLPVFNMIEVCKLTQELLYNPKLKNVYLYPDSPRGFDIIDDGTIIETMKNGKGVIKCRGKMKYIDGKEPKISVYGFPYDTSMDEVFNKFVELVKSKAVTGVKDLKDQANVDGVSFDILLSNSADPIQIMDILYTKCGMTKSITIEFNISNRTKMIDRNKRGLKDILLLWIEQRIEYKRRYYSKKLRDVSKNYHITSILYKLTPELRSVIMDIISQSKTEEDCFNKLIDIFEENNIDISSLQIQAIMDLKLKSLIKSNQEELKNECIKLHGTMQRLYKLVKDDELIKQDIYNDLEEGIQLFGHPRICKIIDENKIEKIKYKYNVLVTEKSIKRLSQYCKTIGGIDSNDRVVGFLKSVPDDAKIYVVDTTGRVYSKKTKDIPASDSSSKGTNLNKIMNVRTNVIRTFTCYDDDIVDELVLTMFTKTGIIKKSMLSKYLSNKSEIIGISLNDNDEVCHVDMSLIDNDSYELIYTEKGFGIAIDTSVISITDRTTKGNKLLALYDGDLVKGVTNTKDVEMLCIITQKGYVKICIFDDLLKTQKRNKDMIKLISLNDDDIVFTVLPITVDTPDTITCILKSGEKHEIDLTNIKTSTRISKGEKLIPIKRGDYLLKIK